MDAATIKRMIGNALTNVRQAFKGKLLRATGGKQIILVQLDGVSGESGSNIPFVQMPGYRGMPMPGMLPIVLPLHGKSANSVVVAMSNGTMFIADLQDGECALFNENDGVANSLILRNGRLAELTCDTFKVTAAVGVEIDTPLVKMTHTLEVAENTKTLTLNVTSPDADASQMAGGLNAIGEIISAGKSLPNHVHPETGSVTGLPTSP